MFTSLSGLQAAGREIPTASSEHKTTQHKETENLAGSGMAKDAYFKRGTLNASQLFTRSGALMPQALSMSASSKAACAVRGVMVHGRFRHA